MAIFRSKRFFSDLWFITQLCRLCYKYYGIGRYRLSVANCLLASSRDFENSVWKSAKVIPVRILLQQLIALLKGVSAHFSSVYCTILKEMRNEGRRHSGRWTHSPKTRSWNKNGGVIVQFSRFRRDTELEIEDLTESKNFFADWIISNNK